LPYCEKLQALKMLLHIYKISKLKKKSKLYINVGRYVIYGEKALKVLRQDLLKGL
jgi:hypothetical protein